MNLCGIVILSHPLRRCKQFLNLYFPLFRWYMPYQPKHLKPEIRIHCIIYLTFCRGRCSHRPVSHLCVRSTCQTSFGRTVIKWLQHKKRTPCGRSSFGAASQICLHFSLCEKLRFASVQPPTQEQIRAWSSVELLADLFAFCSDGAK